MIIDNDKKSFNQLYMISIQIQIAANINSVNRNIELHCNFLEPKIPESCNFRCPKLYMFVSLRLGNGLGIGNRKGIRMGIGISFEIRLEWVGIGMRIGL